MKIRLLFIILAMLPLPVRANDYLVVLAPKEETTITAEVQGTIGAIHFHMGDTVRKGQIVLEFSDALAKGNYEKARAAVLMAQANFQAQRQLRADGIASDYEFRQAEAQYASATADLMLAQHSLDSTVIRAPYDGQVEEVYIREHELASKGTPLVKFVNQNTLVARFLALAENTKHLVIGDQLSIKLDNEADFLTATITRIGPVVDPASGTVKVEAELSTDDYKPRSGLVGRAFMVSEAQDGWRVR